MHCFPHKASQGSSGRNDTGLIQDPPGAGPMRYIPGYGLFFKTGPLTVWFQCYDAHNSLFLLFVVSNIINVASVY